METTDTIAAIATAMTDAGIGIIRISGDDAFSVLSRCFRPKKQDKRIEEQPAYTVHYGYIQDQGEIIDEVLVLLMRGPHSYTAEDTAEIDCHGGVLVQRRILERVLRCGARLAEPGEFTKRAFLNGRLDLSQAEAVMDLIQAKNDLALKTSVSQLKGSVREKITDLRGRILYETAYLESALDDPEHYSLEGYADALEEKLTLLLSEIEKLMASFENGHRLREGVRTVILGRPNAGKSSLLNCLLEEERAIVTEVEGTTRDVLEEDLLLEGLSLRLVDTAGIRKAQDRVEQIGVERAREQAAQADLILFVVDSSRCLSEEDEEILSLLADKKAIILLNKSDLSEKLTEEELRSRTTHPILHLSAKQGTGIDDLKRTITELFLAGEVQWNDQVLITNVRHHAALAEARQSLLLVQESIRSGMPEDFYSIDLQDAYAALGRIIGEEVGEDLVNEIFSRFCMGK